MDALKGFIAKLLPLTPKGWVFLLLSLGLMLLGLLRSELAVLLWGAAFITLSLYAAVGTLFSRALLARRIGTALDDIRVSLEPARVGRGAAARLRLAAPVPRRRVPGIRLYARATLDWNGRRRRTEALVEPGTRQTEVPLDTGRRGQYSVTGAHIVARDLLGFAAAPVPIPAGGTLTVLPDVVETPIAATAAGAGGEHRIHTTLRHRSDELFETRRYVPGDDPRKINWKLFARWNELLVRIGEEVPPPRARVMCYLYTGPAAAAGAPAMADGALDAAVSAFAGICRYLSRRGVEVAYGFGGTALRGTLGATSERELLAELAGADWDGGETPAPAAFSPGGSRLPVLLLSPQGAAGIEDFARRLEGHTRVAERLDVPAPVRHDGDRRQWWDRLLFAHDRRGNDDRRAAGVGGGTPVPGRGGLA